MIGSFKGISARVSAVLLALGLTASQAVPAMAAGDGYTYTVRLFSGAQGTINGQEVVVHEGLRCGDRVTFNQRDVTLGDDSKYYIKGIRESGKDNNTVASTSSFPVTGDMDYVVVYGLLGDAVAYTVNYVDRDGNELAPSETYYGNVGDAPVIAYINIDGYQPQAYNMTGRLDKDASKNVFDFVYTPVTGGTQPPGPGATAAPTAAPGIQPTTAPPAGPAAGTTAGTGGGDAAGDGGEGAAAEEAGGGDADAADADADAGAADGGEGNGPAELEQIGDEEVPLADMGNGESPLAGLSDDFADRVGELPLAAKVGICSAVLLGLGVAGWCLLGRKRKKVGIDE